MRLDDWYDAHGRTAESEGWNLFETTRGIELQRVDDPEEDVPALDGDESAWRLVVARAAAGSRAHADALAFLAAWSPVEYVFILRDVLDAP